MRSFPHAMLREIYEQPDAIKRTLELYVTDLYVTELDVTSDGAAGIDQTRAALIPGVWAQLASWSSPQGEILIAASGSSRHSGLCAEVTLEDLCGLAVDVEYASEYSCRGVTLDNLPSAHKPAVIVISQSGETSDTLAALREAHSHGQKTLAITNAATSTMAREATVSLPLGAGKEFAIPATKSFTCQLTVLYLLALYEACSRGHLDPAAITSRLAELSSLPAKIEAQLPAWESRITELAAQHRGANTFLFLGRGVHYPIAREGALKLKEASYVHAEGYPTGELKHGPNALVSDRVPVVILATVDQQDPDSVRRRERTIQLLEDLQKQKATVIAIANTGDQQVASLVTDCVYVDPASEHLLPIIEVIPLQLFSYFMALEHGVNVDQPRNLAKAVIET